MLPWVWLWKTKVSCALCWPLWVLIPWWITIRILRNTRLLGPPGSRERKVTSPRHTEHAARILPQPIIRPATSASPYPGHHHFLPEVSSGPAGRALSLPLHLSARFCQDTSPGGHLLKASLLSPLLPSNPAAPFPDLSPPSYPHMHLGSAGPPDSPAGDAISRKDGDSGPIPIWPYKMQPTASEGHPPSQQHFIQLPHPSPSTSTRASGSQVPRGTWARAAAYVLDQRLHNLVAVRHVGHHIRHVVLGRPHQRWPEDEGQVPGLHLGRGGKRMSINTPVSSDCQHPRPPSLWALRPPARPHPELTLA